MRLAVGLEKSHPWFHATQDASGTCWGHLPRQSRGDRREAIYLDDVDRQGYLKTLPAACQQTGWPV
jgi:hypothetical protein